jgi:hypothetical protein
MRMKVYLMLAIALIVLGGTALAQDQAPKIEVFGGFSYLRTAANSNVNGWNAQAAYNMKNWIGIVADVGGLYQTMSNDTRRPGAKLTSFMFGPQLSDRAGKITGFVHALIGATRLGAGFNLGRGGVSDTSTNFSMVFGGGIDANLNKLISVRLFQADYDMIRAENPVTSQKEGRNNFRLSMGIVFKLK